MFCLIQETSELYCPFEKEGMESNKSYNLRSGPFLASPVCSLMSSLAKIGPDQKSLKNSGRSAKIPNS